MKKLVFIVTIALAFSAPAFAKAKKTNAKAAPAPREFSWDDQSTWGAHPPSAEDLGEPEADRPKMRRDARDRDEGDYAEDEWDGDEAYYGDFADDDYDDDYRMEERDQHRHPPRRPNEDLKKAEDVVWQLLEKEREKRNLCARPEKSVDDCHFCTDSAESFAECRTGKPDSPAVVSSHGPLKRYHNQKVEGAGAKGNEAPAKVDSGR